MKIVRAVLGFLLVCACGDEQSSAMRTQAIDAGLVSPGDAGATSHSISEASAALPPFEITQGGSGDIVYRGRVMSLRGPVDSARVRLVGIPMGLAAQTYPQLVVWAAVQTDAEGRFVLRVPIQVRNTLDYLVVEGLGVSRTVFFDEPPRPTRFWLGPERPVRVTLECTEIFEESARSLPLLNAHWRRPSGGDRTIDDHWTHRHLVPQGVDWPAPTLPGRDLYGPSLPAGARRFTAEITLPIGRSTVRVDGPCGHAERVVDIPSRGPTAPIALTLPEPGSSGIAIRLTGVAYAREAHSVRARSRSFETFISLRPDEPTLLRGIPSGRYRIGEIARPRCQREVELVPGEVTEIAVDTQSCLVERRFVPWCHVTY